MSPNAGSLRYNTRMKQQSPEDILKLARERIAERHAQERRDRDRGWRLAFWALLVTLLVTLLLAPGDLSFKLYAVVHGLIAQLHNVFLAGQQLPVCARNIGIYGSFLIATGYLWWRGRRRAGAWPACSLTVTLLVFAAIMTFDGFNSLFGDLGWPQLYAPHNWLRTASGLLFGTALTGAILLVWNQVLHAEIDRNMPIITWPDLAAVLLLNSLLFLLVYSNIGWLYWPLAWFVVLGILGELYMVNVLVIATMLGYGKSVRRLRDLARPATLALLSTTVIVGGLALWRFSLQA
jgi:uncharacterized membrane protein